MVPGANFSNGTGAKHFQTWHRCQILNGTGATPLPNWHQCQFSKWHRCQAFSNFGTGAKFWMAPVPHLCQIGTGANFLNVTSAGAKFSNGTSAKHFQTLAPVPCFEWHRYHTFTKLAPVPIFYMSPVPQLFKLGTSASLSNGTSTVALVWTIFRDWGCVHWCKIDLLLQTRRLIRPCRSCGHKSRAIFCSIDWYMTSFMDMAPMALPPQHFFWSQIFDFRRATVGYLCLGRSFSKHKMTTD